MAGLRHHPDDGRAGGYGQAAWRNRRRFERRPSGGRGDRCLGKLPERLAGAAGPPMARALIRLRLSSAMRWLGWSSTPVMLASPSSSRELDFRQKKAVLEGESRRYSRMLSSFSLRQGQGLLRLPRLSSGSGGTSGEPGLQFGDWPGQVHGTIRAQCPSGCCLGAGPSFTRLLRAHSTPVGLHPLAMASMSPSPYLQGSE